MTPEQKKWFDALTRDRAENATALEKPSMRGVLRSVVDKYSDQAHFIYELLQNADDANATSAQFLLRQDGLVFRHNGSTRFSISNPDTEKTDSESGTLGHLNAITSIANSNKTGASIGKFGVGFKAVFQYTKTPHVYDPDFRFKIERFIVPRELDADFDNQKADETVFWFPFDHDQKKPDDSRSEIAEKLKALLFPTLFLSKLETITWEMASETGKYSKTVERTLHSSGMIARLISLASEIGQQTSNQDLWLFSRATDDGHSYCVGYALAQGKLQPICQQPAFCFFPTKETTYLDFILHAPFLLTDSREGIKAGERHNQEMIQQLAELAADSLPVLRNEKLIDDGILGIIPYDKGKFSELDDKRRISFMPFYTAIKNKLQADTLLPSADGECSSKNRSYWASDTELVGLFGDKQLAQLTGTKDAHWVFRSLGKKGVLSADKALADYIDGGDVRQWNFREPSLIVSSLDPEDLLKKITANFISGQTQDWLHGFYAYLAKRPFYKTFVKDKPIFLDQDGNAVAAFDSNGQLILFFPDEAIAGYTTVSHALLSNQDVREFIEKFGVTKPSLRDEIYTKILPEYKTNDKIDTALLFKTFFRYFKECRHGEVDKFLGLIADKDFLIYKAANAETLYRGKASDIYLPTDDLKTWFETKPDNQFLYLDGYRGIVDVQDHSILMEFFDKLGIGKIPRVVSCETSPAALGDQNLSLKGRTKHGYEDKSLDGCAQVIASIDVTRSALLWRTLANASLLDALRGQHTFLYNGKPRSEAFKSKEEQRLLTSKWIINQSGELVSANEVTIQSLSDQYDTSSAGAQALIRFLEIRDKTQDAHLSDEEKRKIKLAEEIERAGLSEDELLAAIKDAKRRKNIQATAGTSRINSPTTPTTRPILHDISELMDAKKTESSDKETGQRISAGLPKGSRNEAEPQMDDDADEYTPHRVDYGKKIDCAKDRCAREIGRLEREQVLLNRANSLPKYSYGWFLALLELECLASIENNTDGKTLSIRFGKIERDGKSARTVILKEPSHFIAQSIEEFSGIRIDLAFPDGKPGKLHVESFTAREFSLEGKLASADALDGIDLSTVIEARIEVQSPAFLLESLLERLRSLGFNEKYDLKANMPENIEFVFGPPGTGKTTHLAEKVLIPLMRGSDEMRVLVLAPTNKAADVLTTRIIEQMGADTGYTNWLVRFGTSSDEQIEQAGVWRDRSFNINGLARSVVVTTIARFAYDGFSINDGKLYEMNWDMVVVDEASMIPLVNIIHPLYRQKPKKFIIAGDPFQIEPIVAVEQWKDENIYTLTGLNKPGSFRSPVTEPHAFRVTHLKTQFRSIPDIGEVFSRFTYDGMLEHHRETSAQRAMRVNGVDVKPLNLIKFPVSKYESIYRPKRLAGGSPYQTYSALFAFEFLSYLAKQVAENHAGEPLVKIGVIAPYRAQANIIARLVDSWDDKPKNVSVQVGTIHGFQGDECDAIIAVFNPPPNIPASPHMFLNKQNILNVAVSRARDYLFIIMPDAQTENIKNLRKVSQIEDLVKKQAGAFSDAVSSQIEKTILGSETYLEDNTFSTGHQMVNVYKQAERHYEVRSDDSAVDVQISRIPSRLLGEK